MTRTKAVSPGQARSNKPDPDAERIAFEKWRHKPVEVEIRETPVGNLEFIFSGGETWYPCTDVEASLYRALENANRENAELMQAIEMYKHQGLPQAA